MATHRGVEPRTFFLNESHEHARAERQGMGATTQYTSITWQEKGERLAKSFKNSRTHINRTADPLSRERYFLLSFPEVKLERASKGQKAKDGHMSVKTDFAKQHARTFEKLGLDLLRVTDKGEAVVHVKANDLDRLEATASQLGASGRKEQNRWAFIAEFSPLPMHLRINEQWLASLSPASASEIIIELQPLLTRADANRVAQGIRGLMSRELGEDLVSAGRDVSGRQWLRVRMLPPNIEHLASEFQSIQSIHEPLRFIAFGSGPTVASAGPAGPPITGSADLPAVAVVDAGIPQDHRSLSSFRRGEYRHPEASDVAADHHGSRVASRIVFGDLPQVHSGFQLPPGTCKFYDAVVPAYPAEDGHLELDGKAVFETVRDVARNAPDVRVFNLSLGSRLSLKQMSEGIKQERFNEMQDLDNIAFQYDAIIVVAAGNTPVGIVPSPSYPGHYSAVEWGIGSPAAGFNTLVVGSFVGEPNAEGVARRLGWPSPFTRVGPGIAAAAVPNFSASGGDTTDDYRWRPSQGLGVTTINRSGDFEDCPGTSFAAPIVAREAAFAFHALKACCKPGIEPFAGTVKAYLALTARHRAQQEKLPIEVRSLVGRSLGHGEPTARRLTEPDENSAIFVWQGTLESPGHIARVRMPIPRTWLKEAKLPQLRLVCAWNTPVFAGAPKQWACRKVSACLRPTLGEKAMTASGKTPGAYPLIDKTYDLNAEHLKKLGIEPSAEEWVVDVYYEDVGPYPPLLLFEELQRVGIAIELVDASVGAKVSPQRAVQLHPMAETMVRLGGTSLPVWSPIKIPTG